MASGLVGIDIGATAVRVVRVSRFDDDGYALVDRVGVVRLREGSVIAGSIKSPQTVALAISSALKSAGVSGYGAVVGLAGANVALASQTLPSAVGRSRRIETIRLMNRQISPTVPLATSELATCLVRTDTSAEGVAQDVLVVAAAARSELEMLLNVCALAKVTPRAVDLAAAGTLRALYRGPDTAGDTATFVDIGASKMTIATRTGGHLRSLRVVAGGGDEITRALMRDGDLDLEEAERRKRLLSLPDAARLSDEVTELSSGGYGADDAPDPIGPRTSLDMALVNVADSLIEQVAQALDNHAVSYGAYPQGVVLCGSGALLRGLKERMHQRLGIDVHLGAPWARMVRRRRDGLDGADSPQRMLELTTAVGLACWREPR